MKFEIPAPRPRMECVLDETFTRDIPKVQVYIGKIADRKNTSKSIVLLNAIHPVYNLQHLKRVRGGTEILLCLADGIDDPIEFLTNIGYNIAFLDEDILKIDVASEPPKTRKQFEQANKLWPCNFHEDKYVEKLVNNTYSEKEMEVHEKWMRMALECHGVVIVDPKGGTCIASSSSKLDEHPLQHSIMVAIDHVARSQGGGAWGHPTVEETLLKGHDGPYLCTDYYAYCFREPCIMCAMALVHSRVKKVFYSVPSKNGVLGTSLKLHVVKALNHHYEVYKGVLYEEGVKLLEKDK
ncbi:probable inactive tRNA-specific adenosine deaminase-like protein 3 [Cimex lectularius]|uniref:CMP/dCMP-type deaminase domain-containing protein n=1 Tax=Cimex lectularius TaxID=79782 RepID=A0A8I6S7N9_CIMLE|nr:probable inactive tRNA-specific adenosine deaminase-like protein 3 [Cimex lectularius]